MLEESIAEPASAENGGKKTALVLLAHHHLSNNIASQRFSGLLRHLPRDDHSVLVISGRPSQSLTAGKDLEVCAFDAPLLSQASFAARLEVLWCMVMSSRNRHVRITGNSWIAKAVNAGKARVQGEKGEGRRAVVMATYSPIDALIASRLIALSENVPMIQDFRDGLAFENLGRPGVIFKLIRKILEAWAVRNSSAVSTVSRPLVQYFQKTYPGKEVFLLYNGFDSQSFPMLTRGLQNLSKEIGSQPVSIGHFGRISASDASRLDTFRELLKLFKNSDFGGCLEFFGALTKSEESMLEDSGIDFKIHGHVDRKTALENMAKMSALLLITGNGSGVATGKLYEYLFSGQRIIIATQCRNEAIRILEELGDEDVILDLSGAGGPPCVDHLEAKVGHSFVRNADAIKKFDKAEQAKELSEILTKVAGVKS